MYDLQYESTYAAPYSSSPLLPLLLISMMSQKHTPDTKTNIEDVYDYIVVGSGSAGSVVASRLVEKSCVTVLLLEAGSAFPKISDLPVIDNNFLNTDLDWHYTTVPQTFTGRGLVNKSLALSAGKGIGGTSMMNGNQATRGNKKDYDDWAALGASGWAYKDVLPYFKKLEDEVDPKYRNDEEYHGKNGPITISKPRYKGPLQGPVYEAAKMMGYKVVDINGATQKGFTDLQATLRKGQRCSAAKGYLVPKENYPNLHIVADAFVTKILIENKTAVGVEVEFQGMRREVRVRSEVILSAGAISSPRILMTSGIGPKEDLEKHNIDVIADLPVGFNLQEHWGVLQNFELSDNIESFASKKQNSYYIWQYILFKSGPLTSISGVSNFAFLRINDTDPDNDYPDYQLYFLEGVQETVKRKMRMTPHFLRAIYEPYQDQAFYYCLSQILHPKSRGQVTLRSQDPHDPPLVDPKYFSHPEDMDVIIAGMKKCMEFGTSEPLRRIGSKPFSTIYPGCEMHVGNDDNLYRCIAESIIITDSHQVGTVKMGDPNDPTTVLDPELKVKGINNLRVVDASVMPTIISGNTNLPTIMIAEKASDIIKRNIFCGN